MGDNMINFSEKIYNLRKKYKISQKDLGKKLGISNRAVSKWETGISVPSTENFVKLSEIFGVNISYFFEEEKAQVNESASTGMESIKELYKVGRGPSSSHTIGPERACMIFKERNIDADEFFVTLYGSLAKTGVGHGTDTVIKKTLAPTLCTIKYNCTEENLKHPNTMEIVAMKNGKTIDEARIYSVGGGSIEFEGEGKSETKNFYKETSFRQISEYCRLKKIKLWQYVEEKEDKDFYEFMKHIWLEMKKSIENGLEDEGILPGGLGVQKKAKYLYNVQHIDESAQTKENRIVCAYAFAVSEQNASGERIVTAPTCGAAGVLPAVMYYYQKKNNYSDEEIIHALETAGLMGNLIKTNASISGAECGCQVEVGSACAMASAALSELFDLSIDKIEYAAEIAIEHHLGLTCDPIGGFVQIPCIERNAVAAMRAINGVNLASFLSDTRKISFDKVVKVMKETGHDMSCRYKETSEAGLAKIDL
jgi:L-serine dehydratase